MGNSADAAHIEQTVLEILKDATEDLTMEQVVLAVRSWRGMSVATRGAIKSSVLALVNTERVELTSALKLRAPPPPSEPDVRAAELAKKLKADPTKILIITSERSDHTYYEFEDLKPRDLPRERRINVVKVYVGKNGTKDRVYRSHRASQKFLCAGGPFDRQWKTEDEAEDYIRFNSSVGRRRAYRGVPARPSAVLVHESAFRIAFN